MTKPTARTVFEYWTYLIKPSATSFPAGCTVETTSQPSGLFLTIKRREGIWNFDLIGRSRINFDSKLAANLMEQLVDQYGELPDDFESITFTISHRILSETKGREALIEAFDADDGIDLKYFTVSVLSVVGNTDWPEAHWSVCKDPAELQERYVAEHQGGGTTGLLIRVTDAAGQITWYRRPLEFKLVVRVCGLTENRVYLRYRDPCTGAIYNGHFNRGVKNVLETLIEDTPDLKGRLMEITTKSIAQIGPNEYELYAIRYERLVEEFPSPDEQFKLV